MELNEYQKKAMGTCLPSSENFSYMMLNLVGEVGELASKVAKLIRKGKAYIDNNKLYINTDEVSDEEKLLIQKEIGDILWQTSGLCSVMKLNLEDIAQQNLDKLASRQGRGRIDGDGDNR